MNQLHPERQIGAQCPRCEEFPLIHAKNDKSTVYCTNPTCEFGPIDRTNAESKRQNPHGQGSGENYWPPERENRGDS